MSRPRRSPRLWFALVLRLVLDVAVVIVLVLAIRNENQILHERDQRRLSDQIALRAAHTNCEYSNDSRRVIINVLTAAEENALAPTGQLVIRADQRAALIAFYQSQIGNIKLSDCEAFTRASRLIR